MAVKSMETVVEATTSMEMAPGALPCPGRMPVKRLMSPEIGLRQWRRCGTFTGKTPIFLGFFVRRLYIGGEAASGSGPGGLTPWWRGQGLARAALGCGQVLAPLRLCFGLRLVFWKNRRFGFCFVQFRKYFLCSFSETQKEQKIGT
jgi:hypothetical protein